MTCTRGRWPVRRKRHISEPCRLADGRAAPVSAQAEIEGAEPSRAGMEPRRGTGRRRRRVELRGGDNRVGERGATRLVFIFFSCEMALKLNDWWEDNINNMLIHGVYMSPIINSRYC